ncbi:VWA domain-containing protein, partial [Nevskia soli]|uniref:VWA domain-containing protein n=1 Tax=Nevskia soli TaxID=418856 RepID=UPI0015D80F70
MLQAKVLFGATPLTVQQLQELVQTAKNSRRPDMEVARRLSNIELSERLSDARLQELLRESSGSKTSAALQLMADKSVFEPAPKSDWLNLAEPAAEAQSAILARIRQYASRYVQGLPNYLVTAEIRRFDDDLALSAEKRPLWHQLRARDRSINQLRYSDGQESYSVVKVSGTPNLGGGGLKTLGEFAGIFAALFVPDSGVTMRWDHWETVQGAKAAVFAYSVPALHSRFTVMSGELHINPSYQGRLFADPDSGAVLRMTRQADDQPPSFPTRRSDTFVAYGPVKVGESTFLLPLRSVTFSEVTGPRMVSQVLPHYPFTRSNVLITSPTDYLNETLYSNYRKFEADSKLVFDAKPETDAITANAAADTRPEPTDAELNLSEATRESAGPNAQPDEKVTPTFQASAKLVEVSVVARDEKGRLIRDLNQRDFAIYDGDKPQQIRLFKTNESPSREPSTQAPQAAQSEQSATVSNHGLAASHQGAINVILFDELNTVWVDQVDARNQVIKFLSQMNPKERIGLYLLTPWGPQILQDITTDSSELVQILASRTSGGQVLPSFTKGSHPSDITLGLARWVNGQDRGFRWSQLQGSPDPLTAAANAPLFKLMNSLVMLKAVINHLAGVPGRKNLIWISANLPDFTAADSNRILSGAMRVAVDANVSIYPIDARGVIADPGYSAAEREAPVPWALRSSVVRYNSTLATMLDAASKTGGRASISNGDISGAIRSAIDDSHFTYTLGFYPESLKYDGTYHSLTVKVKERPKITLLYRPGYMDARPVENVEKELSDALWSPLDASGIGLTANLSSAQSGGCEVRVVIDAEALVLLHKEDRWTGKIDVSMAQKDEEGSLYDREDQNIVPNVLPKTYRDMLDHGFTYNHVFARNANATCLRVVVHDQGSGNLGSVTV